MGTSHMQGCLAHKNPASSTSSPGTLMVTEHLQGYLAHKKMPPPRTLQEAYAWGPTVVLGGGRFLVSEVPL